MPITARSTPNIALIKYWGNRNNKTRLPAADSLSITLDSPTVEIDIDHADALRVQSFEIDGSKKILTEKQLARFQKHLDLTREYFQKLGVADAIPHSVSLIVRSHIPSSVGLASSAAVFSCLAKAYAGLVQSVLELTLEQTSVIARLGSGSAARSIFGGYAALNAGTGNDIDAAKGKQIADENHWMLHDIVIVPSHDEKKVGSTEGHELAPTSPYFADRIEAIRTRRQKECVDAILKKDFEKLRAVTEEDALDMHHVMETSTPPLKYLTSDTHRILKEITALRESEHLPVLYTMDAGPTVHLICESDAVKVVQEFAETQKNYGCSVFVTKVGPGAAIL